MQFRFLEDTKDYYWNQAWELYNSNFKCYQRRSLKTQLEVMKNSEFKCLAILERKALIGILFYWDLENIRYVEHLAYNSALKGKGYEKRILSKLCDEGVPIIIEIEKEVNEDSLERLLNYEEVGFKRNIFEHKRPSYNKEHNYKSSIVFSYPRSLTFEDYLYFSNILINRIMSYRDI